MLSVKDLNVYYGAIHAIKGVSFEVLENEIVTLIGANGAGKTTILQTISGLIKAGAGEISFLGSPISGLPAHLILKRGVTQVPERRRVFSRMTVMENLEMGAYTIRDKHGFSSDLEMVFESFPRLKERRKQIAGTLSGGEQQMLAMGRALMSRPRLLLLDEPSMGLSPILVTEIFKIIKEVSRRGVTILLVEQNARMAMSVASRAYVLETGRIVLSGATEELVNNEEVKKAYLGA